ncbi:MAG: hypothetical protein ACK50Q_12880 [Labrys sp. (in: a-proteobacteria)]
MADRRVSATELTEGDRGLVLIHDARPMNRAFMIGGTVLVAVAAIAAIVMHDPALSGGSLIASAVIALLAIVGTIIIARARIGGRTVATFDAVDRVVVIDVAPIDGTPSQTRIPFDAVKELFVFSQSGNGSRVQTMMLVRTDGPSIRLAQERRVGGVVAQPAEPPLVGYADMIAARTGLPRAKTLPGVIAATGSFIGARRD